MANYFQLTVVLVFLFSIAVFLNAVAQATSFINFTFPSQGIPELNGSAYNKWNNQENTIELTSIDKKSVGWAVYNKAIPLWNASPLATADFSTHFQFKIELMNSTSNIGGDGLAFFLAASDFKPNDYAFPWFGLFYSPNSPETSNQIVAVEFDTFMDDFDPDDNHVGIDVNSIVSKINVSLGPYSSYSSGDGTLMDGEYWDAWVDYDGKSGNLQVFLLSNPSGVDSNISKPKSPILKYDIVLSDYLPENIKVGLSASTWSAREGHSVYSWDFSFEYSWEIESPTASPPMQIEIPTTSPAREIEIPTTSPRKNAPHGSPPKKNNDDSVKAILISVFATLVGLCAFIFLGVRWYLSRHGGEGSHESDVEMDEWFAQGPRKFSYVELSAATRNFNEDEKLGQGGFGGVYRGILPGTNETVAVKRISQGSKQGKKEYVSEVTIISKLRHRNLVQLLGWCHQKGELLLVYEYLPNGSLVGYIFGEGKGHLDWDRRYIITCDIASALVYLHEEWDQRVVHRDVKASNVMLDSNFSAKLGDFGLARVVERDHATSHTTVVAGTLGYLAPECVITGKASPESDVFSFGAVTLEIACGKRPMDSSLTAHNSRLVEWVWDLYGQRRILDAADERLGGNFNGEEMERLMLVGLLCSHPDPKARPRMKEVIKILTFEAQLPYVPLNLPVAVYTNTPFADSMTSSTSITLNSSSTAGVSVSSSASVVNVSFSSEPSASSSNCRPLLHDVQLTSISAPY